MSPVCQILFKILKLRKKQDCEFLQMTGSFKNTLRTLQSHQVSDTLQFTQIGIRSPLRGRDLKKTTLNNHFTQTSLNQWPSIASCYGNPRRSLFLRLFHSLSALCIFESVYKCKYERACLYVSACVGKQERENIRVCVCSTLGNLK